MVFKGFEVIIKPRKKNYANEGFIYAHCDQSHFWALKDISTDKIVLKSDLFETKEGAVEASESFMERLYTDFPKDTQDT